MPRYKEELLCPIFDTVILGFQVSNFRPNARSEPAHIALPTLNLMGVEKLPHSWIRVLLVHIAQHLVPHHTARH